MATSQINGVIQHLRSILRDGAGLTDGQLLEDYISRRDEASFAALVRRHGPMVWGVCRRVLRNHHAAEDAFQATFLVLVRRAASIASRELLANWLYGVAHQTALKARATAAKRKGRERQVTDMPEPAVTQEDQWHYLQPVLDEELSRLPDKYRGVIVLCDLEGKTRKEVAAQLDCPEGTVASRLVRARVMLAKRLAQRGVALSGGALATVLAHQAASAGVPNSVVVSTIQAASLFAAGKAAATGAISVKVAALTEGVMKAMLFNKLKAVIAVVLILSFVVTGATILTSRTAAGQDDKKPAAENPVEPAAKQDKQKEKDKETVTAWGKEVAGLQAGLGFRPGERRVYRIGETITFVVLVRNVGKKDVKIESLSEFFFENAPSITDGDGKPISLEQPIEFSGIPAALMQENLAPGKGAVLCELDLRLRPASEKGKGRPWRWTLYETGKFQVQFEKVGGNIGKVGAGIGTGEIRFDPILSKLATGKLELEVKAEKPKENDPKAEKNDAQTSLAGAIKALNKKASVHSVGKDETPITEQEVIAAIRAAERPKDSAVTDKLFDAFKNIAETKQLPPGAELEAVGGIHDPGTAFIYDVWWVRLRVPKEANGTYGFVIRERIIRSRTLQEELARLEKERPGKGEPAIVDGGRLQDNIDDLKARIEKMKTK